MNNDKKCGKFFNLTQNDLNNLCKKYKGCKIAVMISVENNQDVKLLNKNESYIDLIRLHVRINNIDKNNLNKTIEMFNRF